MDQHGFFHTADDATIYYEIHGEGQPLLLVHGWGCSMRFWQRNVPELSKYFQVVTLDLRGTGRSSKGLHGLTISQMATDVHDLIHYLYLDHVILMGWSMGGPIVMSYWKQYNEHRHVAGMGLIDMTPAPFSAAPWNSHSLRNYNAEGFNNFQQSLLNDKEKFIDSFIVNMYPDHKVPAGTDWVKDELMKQPAYIGMATYSDYCYNDFTPILKTIDVPTLVFAGNSAIFPRSEEQGAWEAQEVQNGKEITFDKGGHMLFYVEADKFNRAIIDQFYHRD